MNGIGFGILIMLWALTTWAALTPARDTESDIE